VISQEAQIMATVVEGEQRFVLHNASWELYEAMLTHIGDRAVRLTYDQGELQLMSPSAEHERIKGLLGRLFETLTEELRIPIISLGSTTYRRRARQRGLEPDECYYLRNLDQVRGKSKLDPAMDPPPDLAIEVDIMASSLDRMSIYASLGVCEVWRYDGQGLAVFQLDDRGEYKETANSGCVPVAPLAQFTRCLYLADAMDDTAIAIEFRQWVREHLLQ
jgi:Uma2 family endonuclease